ncbi:MAG: methyltransferase domain-containing protein [Gammaproteobacteria bacterium]|nr:methyltransferase domain-containing protein [Gammaproteobacteria bacterium]
MNKSRNIFSPSGNKKSNQDSQSSDFENPWLMARDWYSSELGQALLANERQSLDKLLEQIFGYNLVQLGCLDNSFNTRGLTGASRTSYQYLIESLAQVKQVNPSTQLLSDFAQLPIQNHSVDAVLLPHTLEFEPNPHQILREVERILVAEGKAIFLGFNPFSTWGLWHKYWHIKNKSKSKSKKRIGSKNQDNNSITCQIPLPSCGHLISQKRLRDWLQLLGFDIELVSEYFYRPPIRSSVLLKKLEFMEQAGQFSKLLPAGGYLLVATKRVSTLTPIREGWKFTKQILSPESVGTAGLKSTIHSNLNNKTKIQLKKDEQRHGKK